MMSGDFLSQPIEVAAASPRLEMIRARLASAGMRPYTLPGGVAACDPLLIDIASASPGQVRALRQAIGEGASRAVVLLGPPGNSLVRDAILVSRDSDLASVPARLALHSRRAGRTSEAKLRASTLAALGRPLARPAAPDAAIQLLFVTAGSPLFAGLRAGLARHGIGCSAALTALTAREHLLAAPRTAIVVDAAHSPALAAGMSALLRETPALAARPVYVLGGSGPAGAAILDGLADHAAAWLDSTLPLDTLAGQLAGEVAHFRATQPLQPGATDDPAVRDGFTGLFTRLFFEAHLDAQITEASGRPVPLSLVVLKPGAAASGGREPGGLPGLASAVMARARDVDCPARLDWSSIAISLRGTGFAGARRFAERLAASLAADAPGGAAMAGGLTWRIAEKRAFQRAETLIRTAQSAPPLRLAPAAPDPVRISGAP